MRHEQREYTKLADTEAESPQEFTSEAKEALERQGYIICDIEKKSLMDLGSDYGFKINLREKVLFWRTIREKPQPGQVAYKPGEPFLEGSNNKTYDQQREMVEKHVKSLGIQGTQGFMGSPAEFLQVEGRNYTRTDTKSWLGGEFSARTAIDSIAINSRKVGEKDFVSRIFRGKRLGFHIFVQPNAEKAEWLYAANLVKPA